MLIMALASSTTPSRIKTIGASGQEARSRTVHSPPMRNTPPQVTQNPSILMFICKRASCAAKMRMPRPTTNHPQGIANNIGDTDPNEECSPTNRIEMLGKLALFCGRSLTGGRSCAVHRALASEQIATFSRIRFRLSIDVRAMRATANARPRRRAAVERIRALSPGLTATAPSLRPSLLLRLHQASSCADMTFSRAASFSGACAVTVLWTYRSAFRSYPWRSHALRQRRNPAMVAAHR